MVELFAHLKDHRKIHCLDSIDKSDVIIASIYVCGIVI